MMPLPISANIRRLLASVKKLENSLHSAGLPHIVARLPVFWLCWCYCRMLDQKTVRMKRVAGKFEQWLPTIQGFSADGKVQMELIDIDQSMRRDIEGTKNAMWDLHKYCVDVGRMFDDLGYQSKWLQRRQAAFLEILESACAAACRVQAALEAHDNKALALLRAEQLRERALAAVAPS